MTLKFPFVAGAIALVCAFLGSADAQVLYKLIDKNGKITYSENPPKDFDGKVIRLDIDPNRNTATLPSGDRLKQPPPEASQGTSTSSSEAPAPPPTREQMLETAKAKLAAARRALQDAIDNPGPDDVRRVGNVGGGTRPVFSEEYQMRLDRLERDVTEAENEVRRLQ